MPRLGLGMPIVSGVANAPVTVIDDVLWEDFGGSGGEIAVNYQETRTNIVLHSQDATDAEAWTKTNTAIDSTLYEAPDNSTTANAIKSDSTGTKVYRILQGNLSVTTGKTYTLSVHVKKGTLGFARVQFNDSSVNYSADFNLNTAAVTNTSNTIRTQVDSMDDDWYRCSITFQVQNTTSSGVAYVFAQSAAGSSTPNVAVSGVVLLYVWGFQLEESIEATSYIVTTTSARTATTTLNDTSDVWDFDGANLMPEADPNSEGVWEEGSNLVLNHDYADLSSELVTDGTFDLGSEIITNGDFATDSNWTKDAGWSIANGVASCDGTQTSGAELMQTGLTFTNTKIYKVTYTITVNAGTINTRLKTGGSTVSGPSRTTSGTYTEYLVSTGNTTFRMRGHIGFIGSVDNISIKQVDWDFESSWSFSGGKAVYDAAVQGHYLKQTLSSISAGETVKIQFDISDVQAGKTAFFKLEIDGSPETVFTYTHFSAGTYTYYHKITSGLDRLNFVPATSSTGGAFSIDNVSVKQVDPNDRWVLDSTYSIEDGKLKAVNGATYGAYQANILTSGTTYEIKYTISDYSSGTFAIRAHTTGGITATADGTYTDYITSNGPHLYFLGYGTFNGSVDNVTVKEYAIQPKDI